MRIKNWLRWLILGGLITTGSLTAKKAGAVGLGGFFVDTPNCTTQIYRKPIGSIDTLETITDGDGYWVEGTENLNPPAQINDTLYIEGKQNGKIAQTMWIVKPSGNDVYDMHLDKHTVNIENVIDTSGLANPLYAIYSLDGVAPCTTEIDTGYDQGWTFYYDIHAPFNKSDATHGKQGNIDLVKTVGDTTWKTSIPFTVDKTAFDAQALASPIYFPEEIIVNDTTPPEISNATEWPDTTHKGPFAVSYDRIDGSGILSDSLIYKVNQGTSKTVPADSVVGDKAYCTIDTIVATDDSIHYKVKSIDASANTNVAYWPASGWHSFKVNSIGNEESQPAEKSFRVSPNPFYSNVNISAPVEKAELNIYDVSGRLVDKVQVNDYKAEWGKDTSKGVYFVRHKSGKLNGKIEVKNKGWKLIKL